MKALPAGLAVSLASGVTTLARCWRVERTDGVVLGFTDCDKTLSFGGVDYEPETGFTAAAAQSSLGLAVDTAEVEGALASDRIAREDLALGLYDDAAVEVWLVDWSDVADRFLLKRASIGEVTRGEQAFRGELRSLAHRLNQEMGRSYTRTCDAVLGDARCGINLNLAAFKGTGAVTAVPVPGRSFTASGLGSFANGWFAAGTLLWLTGDNAGAAVEVKAHRKAGGTVTLGLWQRAAAAIEAGDTFEVRAGCDKSFATCQAKFDNAVNFRGFPHMPGNDLALSIAESDDVKNDGGSLFS